MPKTVSLDVMMPDFIYDGLHRGVCTKIVSFAKGEVDSDKATPTNTTFAQDTTRFYFDITFNEKVFPKYVDKVESKTIAQGVVINEMRSFSSKLLNATKNKSGLGVVVDVSIVGGFIRSVERIEVEVEDAE